MRRRRRRRKRRTAKNKKCVCTAREIKDAVPRKETNVEASVLSQQR